ncbi:collagen-like protein [Methylobacter psychrophilus]|uniref:collagen-like protein n=1 Tax=Methylobacter psychrophilus TaxID=96941 RepID=UPI0021D4F13E|nr:collagen-like protein [Methylobacter psychrophilus]
MPHINELILLARPVQATDTLIIEAPEGTRRLAATAFKGETGTQGLQGERGLTGLQGVQGLTGDQGPPGTASGIRETATVTTGIIANLNWETGTFSMATSFELLQVVLSSAARIRLYNSAANRDADVGRSVFQAPTQGMGLILDINAVTVLSQTLDPHAHGSNMEAVPSDRIYYTVTNNGAPAAITVAFTFLRKEH